MHGASEGVYINGKLTASRLSNADFTAYVSPYLVVSPGGNYTKHIYAGSQRIASRLANGTMSATTIPKAGGSAVNYTTKRTRLQNALIAEYDSLGAVYTAMPVSFTGSGTNSGNLLYFYHPDHLGSSSLITNADGAVTQHVQYVPFGEVFIEERNITWNTPYLFNAKELDDETGLYYYGARYYDPRTSVWLSTDPMQEKYPGFSTYAYTFNNPIKFIDPTGMEPDNVKEGYKNVVVISTYSKPKGNEDKKGNDLAQIEATKGAKKLKNNTLLIFAKNKKDMLTQIEEQLGDSKINNLIISGHGNYNSPGIFIGDDYISGSKGATLLGKDLSGYLESNESSIVLASCHTGAGKDSKGEIFTKSLANASGANVYTSRTWTVASAGMFDNGGIDLWINYANFQSKPLSITNERKGQVPISVANYGKWTLALPNTPTVSIISNLYFKSNGNFKYNK